ncbi:DUF2521 family protein [Bacillus fonticola]|uniref:DUF2521 family protein n=1 Tax=Bacillus fonticola TaxID=2728853 RepID=UPI001474CDCC|nr:DUF2521 family protein [Bacillus fonticola]
MAIVDMRKHIRERQLQTERLLLRGLSVNKMRKEVASFMPNHIRFAQEWHRTNAEDHCIDVAIEAYLLGGQYAKFNYHGEEMEAVRKRAAKQEQELIHTLFDTTEFWGFTSDLGMSGDDLYLKCDTFVSEWWQKGFDQSLKRLKLRLKMK